MPFIYPAPASLISTPKVGNGDCVALVRTYANMPSHWHWREGEKVLDNRDIRPGTAIATFVKGRYPNNETGQHAAFFLRHDAPGKGFWVVDRWKDRDGKPKRNVNLRLIRTYPYKQNRDGTWWYATGNAQAFSIIEIYPQK